MTQNQTTKHFGGATAKHDESKNWQSEQLCSRLRSPPFPSPPERHDSLRQERGERGDRGHRLGVRARVRGDEWARSWGADAVRWGHGVKGRGIKRATGRGGERVRWREYEGARVRGGEEVTGRERRR
jgi:hypothetical protein